MNQIRKVGTLTLGCKVNQYETDAVRYLSKKRQMFILLIPALLPM